MKKQNKGFTIVELVIVIAVIAILAAVLIPTFSNIIKKAQQSSDTQLIRNLNGALAIALAEEEEDIYSNAYQAFNAVEEAGYNVAKIVSKSGYNIAYDVVNGYFVLLDEQANTVLYPLSITDSQITKLEGDKENDKVNYFVVRTNVASGTYNAPKNYSLYCGLNFAATEVVLDGVGFDAGSNTTVKKVNYSNNGTSKKVVIRTNDESVTLNINAPLDTIKHYDNVGIVNITRTANASYHEFGTACFVQNASGRVVAENGGIIKTCVLTEKGAEATLNAVAQEDGGKIEVCYATTNAVASANNGESTSNVQLVVESLSNEGNVLAEGKTTEEISTIVESKMDEVAAEANNENYSTFTGDARIGSTNYNTLQDALTAAQENEVIVLLKDVTYAYTLSFNHGYKVIVDFSSHKLSITNGAAGAGGGRAFKVNNTNAKLYVKNGIIDGRNYTQNGVLNPKTSTSWGEGSVGGCFRIEYGYVNLNNMIMYNNDGWGSAVSCRRIEASVDLTNCTIDSTLGACIEISNGNIKDCTFIQRNQESTWQHLATCIGACYGGVVNIYDSSTQTIVEDEEGNVIENNLVFTEGKGTRGIYIFNSGCTVNIYGGKFSGALNSIKIDYPNDENAGDVSIVNVYGGNFEGPITVAKSAEKAVELNVYGGTFTEDVSSYKK